MMKTRYDLINHFIRERGFKSFLEIGTANGETFRAVECERKVCVDPDPETYATFVMTSDEFFSRNSEDFDIVFVDGFHEWHQALKDVQNAFKFLNPGGVIVMHDCHPVSEECARHMDEYRRPDHPWCGDVWKAFVRLRSLVPFLMYVWDHDYGCGVIDTTRQATMPDSLKVLPYDVDVITYDDFVKNPEWMNFRELV